jgi:hypothetical protein
MKPVGPPRRWCWVLLLVGVALGAALGYYYARPGGSPAGAGPEKAAHRAEAEPADLAVRVRDFCTKCHAYPSPDSFPRRAWRAEVARAYRFLLASSLAVEPPPFESVVAYYEQHAPEELPPAVTGPPTAPPGIAFERVEYPGPPVARPFAVSNVSLVSLPPPAQARDGSRAKDVLATDMRSGLVMLLRPAEAKPVWRVIADHGKNPAAPAHPAHAEVFDLDGDGLLDVLVADLGSFTPTDDPCGRVVWLRGLPDGEFEPVTLMDNVGRVADVRPADFNGLGRGRHDLLVASFGWQAADDPRTGVFRLENRSGDWRSPRVESHRLDARHGAIHVPVTDLDGDGRPDFVALFAQEHEAVVAFLNEGGGKFRRQELYAAPDPAYGSSGIELVDLDGDGKIDVLYTNGDSLDEPFLFKPYHGVRWLRNLGGLRFEHHLLAPMYGAHRAVAADFFGDGRNHIAAVSFLPRRHFPDREKRRPDSVVLLRQVALGRFERHALAATDCDHATCVAGDIWGTGRIDLVVGNFDSRATDRPVTIWRNLGPTKPKTD